MIPYIVWGLFGFLVGFFIPSSIKNRTYQIVLIILLPIFGSFIIGAMLYTIYEPEFTLFEFNGYFIYGMMHLYYGLLAGVPSSICGFLMRNFLFRKRENS